jgi:very-short-patch-repair endonuclease
MAPLLRLLTYRARALRRAETPAERKLWQHLRGRRLEGAKFRRQQPLGPFIVDFVCHEARLVIEADGAGHFPPPLRDRQRDLLLAAAGLTVLRFENVLILDQLDAVLDRIRNAIRTARLYERSSLLPPGEGRG